MVKFENPGSGINREDIANFEAKWNLKLPEDYVKFLLSQNGGSPIPDRVKGCDETLSDIFPLVKASHGRDDVDRLYQQIVEVVGLRLFLPIGMTYEQGCVLMALDGSRVNKVYCLHVFEDQSFFDFSDSGSFNKWLVRLDQHYIADSFSEFLDKVWDDPGLM